MHPAGAGAPVHIHQIFYDEASRRQLSGAAIPLDNTHGPKRWFEFRPILDFLETHALEPGAWYGFLSPAFERKVNARIDRLAPLLAADAESEVYLHSPRWWDLAIFTNPWEQAERFHPGITRLTGAFLRDCGIRPSRPLLYTDFETSVFSNYIVARPAFWAAWQRLARCYLDYVESGPGGAHAAETRHRGAPYPFCAFIQERLATVVLNEGGFRVRTPDYAALEPHGAGARAQELLLAAEAGKRLYRLTGRRRHLRDFWRARLSYFSLTNGRPVSGEFISQSKRFLRPCYPH